LNRIGTGSSLVPKFPIFRPEGAIDKSLGTKEALAVRLRKLAIDGEKTLQGVAEIAYQKSFQV
jgi:hypothetical protein